MSIKKALMALSVAAACAVPGLASASPITVGGVTWDPDAIDDFASASSTIHQVIDGATGAVGGWGLITSINASGPAAFAPGGELTFVFGGFTPKAGPVIPTTVGQVIEYTGGWVKVYRGNSVQVNQFDLFSANAGNTSDGSLWLDLTAHAINGVTLTGFVGGVDFLVGSGLLDVVGGSAQANFDTNTKLGGADFSFTNSFTAFRGGGFLDAGGTGNFKSDSIPEPASLGLVGLAMLGLGFARRKKQA
ncbi:PEP-CTERM sorting domain-containing protein [Niveibacterium sp. SC-1]|uniref:PEP-CTERM sorting domain-containing protein n=1 Tax=Niveibacterium sp. SC-1 TaxID=3135646 RepID=UPI00311F4EB6